MKVAGKKFVELQTSRPPFRPSRSVPSLSLRVYLRGARPWTLIQRRKRGRLSPRPEPAAALYLSARYGNYTDGN